MRTKEVVYEALSCYRDLERVSKLIDKQEEINEENEDFYSRVATSIGYLTSTTNKIGRHLDINILKKFCIGLGEEAFRDEEGIMRRIPIITFPFFKKNVTKIKNNLENYPLITEDYSCVKTKVRGAGPDLKHFMRFKPAGASFGIFGLNTIEEDSKVVVITEGEYDAMAVY